MVQQSIAFEGWLKNLTLFFVLAGLVLSFFCMLGQSRLFVAIGILSALYLGWIVVTQAYLLVDDRMSVLGDIVLIASIVDVIVVVPYLASRGCSLFGFAGLNCGDNLVPACRFLVAFPMSISSFSLWLWFRIRQARGKENEPIE